MHKKLLNFLIIGLIGALVLSPVSIYGETLERKVEAPIDMAVGEIHAIAVYSPVRIAVADPTVADLVKVEGEEAIIAAKSAGFTTVDIWDKYGRRTINVRVALQDLDTAKSRLEQVLSNIKVDNLSVKVNRDEGKIVLQGDVLTDDKDKLEEILSPFKNQIINLINVKDESALVQIDVQIMELSKSATDQLGIAWVSALQVREEPYSSTTTTTGGATTTLSTVDTFAKIFRIVDWSRDALTAKLNMFISEGKGKVLSRPKLVCMSGKEAEFLVGGQVPIVTTTTSTGGNVSTNVEFRDYGINLKIKPIVKEDDKIDTTINTEVSSIDYANAVVISGSTIPAFATRTASTQLYLKNGQTIFIAGLIKNEESSNLQRLPFISKVPILGELFKSKNFTDAQTELVISLTPTIIRLEKKKDVAAQISKPTLAEEVQPVKAIDITSKEEVGVAVEALPVYLADYARLIQVKISQAIIYPEEARQLGWEGAVRLDLQVLSDGTLSAVKVKKSSGYEIFDDSAVEAAKKAAPYPVFPVELRVREITVEVPVVYNLATNS